LPSRDVATAEALVEQSTNEAVEAVEWAIHLVQKDLERALKAGKLNSAAVHTATSHEPQLKETPQLEQKIKEATSRLEGEKRKLCVKAKDFAATAAAASSQTLLLKVLLVWGNEVRRLRSLVAEQQRVFNKRQQRQPLILARIQADVDQWIYIVFRTWVTIASSSRREVADQEVLRQRDRKVADSKVQLRTRALLAMSVDGLWLQQIALRAWAAERRTTKHEASHQSALGRAATAAAAEQAAMRVEASRDLLTLRLKWRSQGIKYINAELDLVKRAALRTWRGAVLSGRELRGTEEQLAQQRRELGESKRTQGLLVAQAAVEHSQLEAFHAWAVARIVAKCEAEAAQRLEAAARDAANQREAVEQEAQLLKARLSGEARCHGQRLGRAHMVSQKRIMFLRWAIATREAHKEASHRRQLITAAADASAEVYKLRAEGKKVAVELRKQRRAHGVAAIHANLDRRLQSVLLAWAAVVRDSQRESAYQRQLDIAAAESAAGCAVLRMEGRRATLELRQERRIQALRAIDAGLRHWQHLVLREWWAQTVTNRQQVLWEQTLTEERRDQASRMVAAEASHRNELREQAADCEARLSSLQSVSTGAEACLQQRELQHAAQLRAQEACFEAKGAEVARLNSEREGLQAQIAKLHDELRRNHGQP
jgi:hypothetical protein